jgi:polyisoprenoid-binding protein YceI
MSSTNWNLDGAHSQVEFSVKHMMFTTVRGRFSEMEGSIHLNSASPEESSVEVAIDAASLDTRVADRDAHLRGEDFFDVENHPTLTFRSRRVEGSLQNPGDAFQIVGDLTIRGATREVTLDARFEGTGTDPWGGTRAGFSAQTTIDRRDFGLTWNQALEAGGVLVGHEVKIDLQVQAVEVQEASEESQEASLEGASV